MGIVVVGIKAMVDRVLEEGGEVAVVVERMKMLKRLSKANWSKRRGQLSSRCFGPHV